LPGAVGAVVSVLASVVAVTAALGADAFPDGSTATTVNECVVSAASRSTVTARSPVHWTFAGTPFAKTPYVQRRRRTRVVRSRRDGRHAQQKRHASSRERSGCRSRSS
jgi:hypothetical protein